MKELNKDEIKMAIQMIEEASEIIKNEVEGTNKEISFKAFGCFGLDQALGNGNPHDDSLFDLLED